MKGNGFVRSRMRESRTYGSVRGGYRKVPVYSIERIINMKKGLSWLLILLNAIGCLCLAYSSYLFLSGSTIVDAPDAMLPMERWERGGCLLTIGMIPLIITNIFGYGYIQFGNKKNRLLIFIPSVICIILVACFWMKSIR